MTLFILKYLQRKNNMTFDELKNRIEDKVLECYDIASKFYNRQFELPEIDYSLRGCVSGQAIASRTMLKFNVPIAIQNVDVYIKQTVPHEVAHLIEFVLYGCIGHKRNWKTIMSLVFGLQPLRCHSYDTSEYKRNRTKYVYKCNCSEHWISAIRHNRMHNGITTYRCRNCRTPITYTNKKLVG